MKTRLLILFSALSGFLLFASWPADGFTPLIFIALVPLLIVQQYLGDINREFKPNAMMDPIGVEFHIHHVVKTFQIKNVNQAYQKTPFLLLSPRYC